MNRTPCLFPPHCCLLMVLNISMSIWRHKPPLVHSTSVSLVHFSRPSIKSNSLLLEVIPFPVHYFISNFSKGYRLFWMKILVLNTLVPGVYCNQHLGRLENMFWENERAKYVYHDFTMLSSREIFQDHIVLHFEGCSVHCRMLGRVTGVSCISTCLSIPTKVVFIHCGMLEEGWENCL